ncbi:hypothetical protein TUZN_1621 [Thermoproteus uzoniensis 768-20]|uniref:Uncharacterized protein n=1 Tax=Thermoproteus uzoniensis (strain 768-20) TaxID=999630 RepID=F2L2P0_THEU7|nr:hypothetical protein TUZN_1621 [Thermoproteus uzoniensis 768-20]
MKRSGEVPQILKEALCEAELSEDFLKSGVYGGAASGALQAVKGLSGGRGKGSLAQLSARGS